MNTEQTMNRQETRKKRRQLERKLVKAKRNAWHQGHKIPTSVDSLLVPIKPEENVTKKKKKKKHSKKKSSDLIVDDQTMKVNRERLLIEDNELEDLNIKKLEKLLGIKSNRASYVRGFVDDGLDYLLDFCDKDKRKQLMMAEEGDGSTNVWLADDEDQQWLANKQQQQKRVASANQAEKMDSISKKQKKRTSVVKFNEQVETKMMDEEEEDDDDDDDEEEEEEEEEDEEEEESMEEEEEKNPSVKEDIYGRTVDTKGNIIKTTAGSIYVPPALRHANGNNDSSSIELKRRLQGQLNRLSEKNLPSILSEIESLYRSQSRASMNSCLCQLYEDSLLSSRSLSSDSLLAEHALLACLLHANVGLEIGSFLLEHFLVQLIEHANDDVSNKFIDNLIVFISYLYAFHMTNGKILFDIGRRLLQIDLLNEKRLELILLLLKTVGFVLRKDDPLQLKVFLQELRTICSHSSTSSIISTSKRVEFMMDTIKSLKNNDVRKLPGGFEPERIDRLRKLYRSLVKDKTVQHANMLNVGLQDFLAAKEHGRWWIVGSAWQQQQQPGEIKKSNEEKNPDQFSEKIRKLAKQQHMNTDIRRLVFGTLLSSEDCDDAVQKLHKLNLSKVQEREIIHVTVHCCLHEKIYNPFYTLILQNFCTYDRRFQMSLQYHTWDKFKDLSLLTEQQLSNFASALAQLLSTKAVTLNIFKNFNFIELTPSARTFLVEIFVQLFTNVDDASLKTIFQLPSNQTYKFVKDALKLFLSHFILKKNPSESIRRRCQIALDQLSRE